MAMVGRPGAPRAKDCGRALWFGVSAIVASAAIGFWAAPGLGSEDGWRGGGDIEAVGIEEVAAEDREAPRQGSGRSGGLPEPGSGWVERGELGAFVGELYKLWRAIPAYSPVSSKSWLTSGFGWRRGPVTGKREFHGGVDLAAARGTSVVAPADAVVAATFFDEGSGRVVVLDHGNGLETVYGHLDTVLVTAGQGVQRGTALGLLGSTGWRSTGPHLHYGVRLGRMYVDPKRYLFEGGKPPAVTAR